MLENSSKPPLARRIAGAISAPLWVLLGFGVVYLIVSMIARLAVALGVDFKRVDETLLTAILALIIYTLALIVVIGVPRLFRRTSTNRQELGVAQLPQLRDIPLVPIAFVLYMIATSIVGTIAQHIPGFNGDQMQDTGFGHLAMGFEYVLAFVTLVILAPMAEELLFRGYLYGKLRKFVPVWVAILMTSATFGLVHGQWNVGLDVFVLSLALCGLREITGSIWMGVLVHALKNGLAFYLLFINPALLHTIGG